MFTGPDGALHRRSNFRHRFWHPAAEGKQSRNWHPSNSACTSTTYATPPKKWLIEHAVPEVVQHKRLGHKFRGIMGVYSHITQPMIDTMLTELQTRWEHEHHDPW